MPSHSDIASAALKIGMEVHVELATRSKMWTSAPNVAHADHEAAEPNTLLDPVVIGMPGTLPVANRDAVEMSIRVGLALNCHIAERTKWDRKSYWYPDLPKNYQISQYDMPLCYDGSMEIELPAGDDTGELPDFHTKQVGIIRAHLEEDAGKLLHEAPGGGKIDHSIVDLNRAGTPLLEIVTQPDLTTADEAVAFASQLRDLCRHLGVTRGVMQKGHIRFEPNINVVITTHDGHTYATPIVEIKNLNSFRAVHGAITHEYQRQVDAWVDTGVTLASGTKSTRGWDDVKQVTTLQREKEEAHDYRYFPDPDLVTITIDAAWLERIKVTQPETPRQKRERYLDALGLAQAQADQLLTDPGASGLVDAAVAAGADARKAAAFVLNTAAALANDRGVAVGALGCSGQDVADVLRLQGEGQISSNAAADLLRYCCDEDAPAGELAKTHGLLQVSDAGELEAFVDRVLADPSSAKAVEDIRGGKDKAVGALMGKVMKLSGGKANPGAVRGLILERVRGGDGSHG